MDGAALVRSRWRASLHVTVALLAIWFVVSFGAVYFARELDAVVPGWPFSFWVASQGALHLGLVCVDARCMRRLDEAHAMEEA